MPFDLVIFDCDGVLVDSEVLITAIEARLLTELGWPHTVDDVVERYMGRSDDDMEAELVRRFGADVAAEFDRRATVEVRHALETELVAVDGAPALVRRLAAADVATCVASSGSHRKMRTTLGVTDLWSDFEGRIFSSSEVERGKPAPDLFLHAAAQMATDPNRCAVIEDSAPGVQAAIAAGMTAFGYAGGLTPHERLADAGATVFDSMAHLDGLLGFDGVAGTG